MQQKTIEKLLVKKYNWTSSQKSFSEGLAKEEMESLVIDILQNLYLCESSDLPSPLSPKVIFF